MGQFNFKGDRSWIVIAALVMLAPPIGIVALIAKILYMVYINQNSDEASSRTGTYNSRPRTSGYAEDGGLNEKIDVDEDFATIESALKDAFSEWEETQETVTKSYDKDSTNPLATEHLEDDLNESLAALKVEDSVEVDTDVDLTFVDVHIDTEITFDNEPEDHDHTGETPLKVVACTMCGTENRIYKIDVFETPCCEKCGMLLLDRS